MPLHLNATAPVPFALGLDAALDVEDFSVLPPPEPTLSKGKPVYPRPVLQRQHAVMSLEDLDLDFDDGFRLQRGRVVRPYRRSASADFPATTRPYALRRAITTVDTENNDRASSAYRRRSS